jgi:hypothetical protein
MRRHACLAAVLALALAAASGAQAQVNASGSTTLRAERYGLRGDPRAVPWAHMGTHLYQDFALRLHAQPDAARRWEFNASGVVNESEYRHAGQGLIPEWLNFRYEDGAAAVPWRLELGDQRARLSPMTLDRRLQAVRVELQPSGDSETGHSLVWLAGREQTDWRDGIDRGNRFQGASWLVQDPVLGRYALNMVYQEAGRAATDTDRGRLVTSLAAARDFSLWGRHDLTAEAEWGRLDGQVVRDGPDHDDGVRMQLRAVDHTLPLDYRVRYRSYGTGFAPLGTTVERDSRGLEADAGWRLPLGMGLRGRYDRQLAQASERELRSEGYGLSFELPRTLGWIAWIDHNWDLSRRYRADAWGVIDSRTTEARWSIRAAGEGGSATRLAVSWVGLDDHSAADRGSRERRLALTHARTFDLGVLALSAAPGMDYRVRDGYGASAVLNPTLRLDAVRGTHHLGMRLDYRTLDVGRIAEREEYGLLVDYRYRMAQHTLGVEYEQLGREPEGDRAAEAWRAGVFWRYQFDTVLGLDK